MERAFGLHPASNTLSTVGTHLKNLVAAPYHAFIDGPQNSEEDQIKGTSAESGPMNVLGQFGPGAARMIQHLTRNNANSIMVMGEINSLVGNQMLIGVSGSPRSYVGFYRYDDATWVYTRIGAFNNAAQVFKGAFGPTAVPTDYFR